MGDTAVVDETEIVEDEAEDEVAEGAEATRTTAKLFEYSRYVHAGDGAEQCEHREDGACKEAEHFHAWICLPNSLQHRDIQEKARAAKARRKRAMRDAGTDGRPPSDAYVTLESELDDLMLGDRKALLDQIAERTVRKKFGEYVTDVRENDDRFETYGQDAEEYKRQMELPEEQRDDEFKQLDTLMTDFTKAVEDRVESEKQREIQVMEGLPEENVRALVRESRIQGEATDQSINTYYTWLAFICTRRPGVAQITAKRYFATLEDLRNAPPEAVTVIDDAIKDLETGQIRGEAAGNF